MSLRRAAFLSVLTLLVGCRLNRIEESKTDFFADRAAHPTVLVKHAPAPHVSSAHWPARKTLRLVDYPSAGRKLQAVLALPMVDTLSRDGRAPALVYLHGAFVLGPDDLEACTPFLRAGFAVLLPALRGENGNPGDHELLYGELDDAHAAIDFARAQPEIDPSRVVVFGHSAGGMLAALLTLYPGLDVLDTGSAGGIYGPRIFDSFERPFADSPTERRVRLFAPYARQMKHPHFACVGDEDALSKSALDQVARIASDAHLPFTPHVLRGNHLTSLDPCIFGFYERVMAEMTATPR